MESKPTSTPAWAIPATTQLVSLLSLLPILGLVTVVTSGHNVQSWPTTLRITSSLLSQPTALQISLLLPLTSLPTSQPLLTAQPPSPSCFWECIRHSLHSALLSHPSLFLPDSFWLLQTSVPPSLLQRGLPTTLSNSNIPVPTPCLASFEAPATARD